MKTRSIEQLAELFARALAWMRVHGAQPGERILRYAEVLDRVIAAGPGSQLPLPEDEYYSTVLEVSQICDIAELPSRVVDSPQGRRKLRDLSRGEANYFTAGDADQGRDIGFELATAAMFCVAGLDARLDAPADVAVFRAGARNLQIECKRPRRPTGLGSNLMRAYEQIADHRAETADSIALVAVDLTRVINPEFRPIQHASIAIAADSFDEHLRRFELANLQVLADAARDARGFEFVSGRLYKFQGMFHLHDGTASVGVFWRIAMTQAQQRSSEGLEIRAIFEQIEGFEG